MRFRAILAGLAVALALSGCTGDKLVGRPGLNVVQTGELPPPGKEDLMVQQRSYLIGPYDKVAVEVYGMGELTRTTQVDGTGKIALPLIGEIEAAGLSPAQLRDVIATRLRGRFVRDPQVIVTADTVNQMVTVDGQVKEPGLYPVTGRLTLQRAIAVAKGATEYAATNYVVVFRRVNNQDMAALYDLRAIRQGMYADPEVYANDVIYVGESGRARTFQAIIQGSALLSVPLIALLQ